MTFRLTIVMVALLLALPAAALAQGAGDEQYSDPFGPDQQSSQAAPTPTATPMSTVAPMPTMAPTAAPAAPQAAAAPQVAAAPQLPYTGTHEGWIALAGALLLGAGVALRVRLREER